MATMTVPMGSLAITFAILSVLWISMNIREEKKAEEQVKKLKEAKAIQKKPIEFQKEWLNDLLNK